MSGERIAEVTFAGGRMLAFGVEEKRWAEPQYLAQPSLGVRLEPRATACHL
jgi:hypothetical protein